MTVKELIAELQKYDPEFEVVISNYNWGYDSVKKVKEEYVNWKYNSDGHRNSGEHGDREPGIASIPTVCIR